MLLQMICENIDIQNKWGCGVRGLHLLIDIGVQVNWGGRIIFAWHASMPLLYQKQVAILHSAAFWHQKLCQVSNVGLQATGHQTKVMLGPLAKMGNDYQHSMAIVWTWGMKRLQPAEGMREGWHWGWWRLHCWKNRLVAMQMCSL